MPGSSSTTRTFSCAILYLQQFFYFLVKLFRPDAFFKIEISPDPVTVLITVEPECDASFTCDGGSKDHRHIRIPAFQLVAQDEPAVVTFHHQVKDSQVWLHLCDNLSLIHISEPTRRTPISYAVFCLKKKK